MEQIPEADIDAVAGCATDGPSFGRSLEAVLIMPDCELPFSCERTTNPALLGCRRGNGYAKVRGEGIDENLQKGRFNSVVVRYKCKWFQSKLSGVKMEGW